MSPDAWAPGPLGSLALRPIPLLWPGPASSQGRLLLSPVTSEAGRGFRWPWDSSGPTPPPPGVMAEAFEKLEPAVPAAPASGPPPCSPHPFSTRVSARSPQPGKENWDPQEPGGARLCKALGVSSLSSPATPRSQQGEGSPLTCAPRQDSQRGPRWAAAQPGGCGTSEQGPDPGRRAQRAPSGEKPVPELPGPGRKGPCPPSTQPVPTPAAACGPAAPPGRQPALSPRCRFYLYMNLTLRNPAAEMLWPFCWKH